MVLSDLRDEAGPEQDAVAAVTVNVAVASLFFSPRESVSGSRLHA